MKTLSTALLTAMASAAMAQSTCPTANILIGGSSDEQPLIAKWIVGYKTECTNTNLILEEVPCSSSCGARRVCSSGETEWGETPLDVGTLSRPWQDVEATSKNGFIYQCTESDKKILSLNTATYAVTFAVGTGGVAHSCLKVLGGLTVDQLRWIYSNNTREQLVESGWDADSLKNDDFNDNTHLWSELDPRCAHEEILISGGTYWSPDHQFVAKELFGDRWDDDYVEDIPINTPRKTGNDTYLEYFTSRVESLDSTSPSEASPYDLAHHVKNNPAAITFMKYPFAVEYSDIITLVGVMNEDQGRMIVPDPEFIISKDYAPFARYLHINMVNNENTLSAMKGFFEFAFSPRGKELVHETGYFPIMEWEQKVMLSLLDVDHEEIWGNIDCSVGPFGMEIAGSLDAYPVAKVWADVYRAKCDVEVKVRGGGSSRGARRVCGTAAESEVTIGTMHRTFLDSEAVTVNGYEYDCVGTGYKVIQIQAAVDALAVVVNADGVASECIDQLGGLTFPQLRWMYSTLSESQLDNEGWSYDAVPNSDGDPSTHLWSELLDHPDCPPTEIKISGVADDTTYIQFFGDLVLPDYDDGEDYADSRPYGFYQSEDEADLVQYLVDNEDAISFFSYTYYAAHDENIWAVKIQNDNDEFVEPLPISIQDGSYPLSRRVYMNIRDTPSSIAMARPYLELGLSDMGAELVRYTGYIPIPESERIVMRARVQTASASTLYSRLECGPAGEIVRMAGSTTAFNLAKLLGEIYEIGCDVQVQVDGGSSTLGADRICGGAGSPVDIGLMSREWEEEEGTKDGMNVQCNDWDTSRSVIQIPIASTAIALATSAGGDAKACIDILGGLSKDQLRWIFSSYDEKELEASGWNPSSLTNPDFDPQTHLWSELHSDCASTEILLAGPSDLTDIYYDFMKEVLDDYDFDDGEEIATVGRPNGYVSGDADSTAVSFLLENGAGIAFFSINYFKSSTDSLSPVPIQNSAGAFVVPTDSTIQDGSYDFLSKPLYMNIHNDVGSLTSTAPLVRFGMSDDGVTYVEASGYVPLSSEQRQQVLATLCSTEGVPGSVTCSKKQTEPKEQSSKDGLQAGGVVAIIILVVFFVLGVVVTVGIRKYATRKEVDTGDAKANPYAGSRTNWATQEAEVEQTIEELGAPQDFGNVSDVLDDDDDEDDKKGSTPQWV